MSANRLGEAAAPSSASGGSGSNWSQHYSYEALYVDEPSDMNPISPMDIAQGQIGDCGFLAALGEVAIKDPGFIYAMISGNSDGTESVELYQNADGEPIRYNSHGGYVPVSFEVNDKFSPEAVNNYNTNDIVDGVKEIWPQVIEKAFAKDRGGYSQIRDGVLDEEAMETLTGHKASHQYTSTISNKLLLQELNQFAKDPNSIVTLDTPVSKNALPDNLLSNHAYMFDGLVHEGNRTFVALLNPWGKDEPGPIALSQIKHDFDGINHGVI